RPGRSPAPAMGLHYAHKWSSIQALVIAAGRCGSRRKRMKIVAVTNIKSGVGKTTTAVNLPFLCAAGGRRSLLWDLDPQGAATYLLRCEAKEHVSARKLVAGEREIPELVVSTGYDKLS